MWILEYDVKYDHYCLDNKWVIRYFLNMYSHFDHKRLASSYNSNYNWVIEALRADRKQGTIVIITAKW